MGVLRSEAALRRRHSRTPPPITRDYVLKLDDDGGAPLLSVYRRQDHHLPQAGRARAGRAAGRSSRRCNPRGLTRPRCPAAICRRVASTPGSRRCSIAIQGLPNADRPRCRPPRHGSLATAVLDNAQKHRGILVQDFGSRLTGAGGRLHASRRVGADSGRRAVAAQQVRHRGCPSRRARASRPTRRE